MTHYDQRGQKVSTQINADTVNFGITLEDHEKALRRREQEVIERLSQTAPSDRLMREVLEKEYNAVIVKLQDLKASYQAELTSRAEVEKMLQEIKDNLPESQADAALKKFNEGDKEAAKVLFDHVIEQAEKTSELASKAAYENGQMAEQEIRYLEAKDYYQKALLFQPENSEFNNALGFILHVLGQSDKAIEYYQLALASDLKTYGEDHPKVAIRRNNLGEAYRSLGQTDKAIEYYQLALASDLKTYGEGHPDVAIDRNNLGEAYDSLGQTDKAIEYYQLALAVLVRVLGGEHPSTQTVKENLRLAKLSAEK